MKNTAPGFVALMLLSATLPAIAQGQNQPKSQLADEFAKQEKVYQSRGDQIPDGYVVDRSLLSYAHTLSAGFVPALSELRQRDRWLDIGAGRGQAVLDYFSPRFEILRTGGGERSERQARAVAMSIEDRRTSQWHEKAAALGADQIQYLSGKHLHEYSLSELGRFRLITDVAGGFSYTQDLSLFIEKVLAILEVNGNFFTLLTDVRAQTGASSPYVDNASYLTEIRSAGGAETTTCAWLKRISCIEVTCELKANWKPSIKVFHVKKICNDTAVPALIPLHFEAGTPPARRFRLAN